MAQEASQEAAASPGGGGSVSPGMADGSLCCLPSPPRLQPWTLAPENLLVAVVTCGHIPLVGVALAAFGLS